MSAERRHPGHREALRLVATSFLALFAIVGLVLYGLPLYYDFFVKELGWTRAEVTSGNMIGKVLIGPLFGFLAGSLIDRVGPRKPMIVGIVAGLAGAGRAQRRPRPRVLLRVLCHERPRLRAGRAAAQPGAAVPQLQGGPGQGDGHRLRRHRHRLLLRPADHQVLHRQRSAGGTRSSLLGVLVVVVAHAAGAAAARGRRSGRRRGPGRRAQGRRCASTCATATSTCWPWAAWPPSARWAAPSSTSR